MTKKVCGLAAACLAILWLGSSSALAAGSISGKPQVAITNPINGATVHGSGVTVHVSVNNFSLATPIPVPRLGTPAPAAAPKTGHIQYVLDSSANFKPSSDATTSTTHSWKHVSPGPHTVTVYLANSQYVPLPSVKPAKIRVDVIVPTHPMGKPHTHSQTTTRPATSVPKATSVPAPAISGAPTTGGAAGIVHHTLNLSLLLVAALLMVLGALFFLSRRLVLSPARASGSAGAVQLNQDPVTVTSQSTWQPQGGSNAPDEEPETSSRPASADWGTFAVERPPDVPAFEPTTPIGQSEAVEPTTLEDAGLSSDTTSIRAQTELSAAPTQTEVSTEDSQTADRMRAIRLTREWSSAVEDLVRRLDQQDEERKRLIERITELEASLQKSQTVREALSGTGVELSAADVETARDVANSLGSDPGNIMTLAKISQHADLVRQIIRDYVRLQQALSASQQNPTPPPS